MTVPSETNLADDLLWGTSKIAAFLGLSERQADHAIRCGNIPVKRMGKLIVGSKSALRRRFAVDDGKVAP